MAALVQVHTALNATEGYVIRGRLEAEDIPVFTKGEGDGPYRTGPMYLWVPEELEVQARLVLDEMLSGDLELAEDEDVEAQHDAVTGDGWDRDAGP